MVIPVISPVVEIEVIEIIRTGKVIIMENRAEHRRQNQREKKIMEMFHEDE